MGRTVTTDLGPTVVCPATRLLHDGDDYELIVPKRTANGWRFWCDHCRFTWTASDAQVRRMVFLSAARSPEVPDAD